MGPLSTHGIIRIMAVVLVALLLAAQLPAPPARALPSAPVFTVNSTADVHAGGVLTNGICQTASTNNVCTLRAAVEKADNWPGGGVSINVPALSAPGTYLLFDGALVITQTL